MKILTHVYDIMQEVLENTTITAALESGFVQRKSKLDGPAFVKTLVFGWLENPNASYADLAHTPRALGLNVTRQAIEKRMTYEAAETLKFILEAAAKQVIDISPQQLPLISQFNGVFAQDSSIITIPDELRGL